MYHLSLIFTWFRWKYVYIHVSSESDMLIFAPAVLVVYLKRGSMSLFVETLCLKLKDMCLFNLSLWSCVFAIWPSSTVCCLSKHKKKLSMIKSAYISYSSVFVCGWIGFTCYVSPVEIIGLLYLLYSTSCLILQSVLKLEKYISSRTKNLVVIVWMVKRFQLNIT